MRPAAWRGPGRALGRAPGRGRDDLDRRPVRPSLLRMTPTRSTALALIAQYGDDAETIAMLRAAEYAAMGDLRGLADWDEIIADIGRLETGGPGPSALN